MPVLSNISIPRKSNGAESENLIPLIPPSPTEEEENHDLLREFTCKRNPDQKRSATYTLKIPPLKNPKPEKLLEILELVEEAWKGQAIVTAEDRAHFLEQLMGESEKTTFRNALPNDGIISEDDLGRAIEALKKTIFPRNAARLQKKALYGKGFRKRIDMSVREHVSRLQKINRLLSQFPPGDDGVQPVSLTDQDLVDIVYDGLPSRYQKELMRLGFKRFQASLQELVDFAEERIEALDNKEEASSSKKEAASSSSAKKSKRKQRDSDNHPDGGHRSSGKRGKQDRFCLIHGKGHDTGECNELKKFIAQKKEKFDNHPRNRSNNNGNGKEKFSKSHGTEDFHAMIRQTIREETPSIIRDTVSAVMKAHKKREREEHNEIEDISSSLAGQLHVNEYET